MGFDPVHKVRLYAKEDEHLQTPDAKLSEAVGEVLSGRVFKRLIGQAAVKCIKFSEGCGSPRRPGAWEPLLDPPTGL